MIPDYLDVNSGQDRRAALLQRVLGQNNANLAGARQFDRLNTQSSRMVGLPGPPGQSQMMAAAPTPMPGPNRTPIYPGTPVSGTYSLLNLPPALQQLIVKQFAPAAGGVQTNDVSRGATLPPVNSQGV